MLNSVSARPARRSRRRAGPAAAGTAAAAPGWCRWLTRCAAETRPSVRSSGRVQARGALLGHGGVPLPSGQAGVSGPDRQDRPHRPPGEAVPKRGCPHWTARPGGRRIAATVRGNQCPTQIDAPRTMFEKIWSRHRVMEREDGQTLLYVGRHLLHDGGATAFDVLRKRGLKPRAPDRIFATPDHYVSDRLPQGRGDRGPAPPRDGGEAGPQHRRARHPRIRPGRSEPGHRPCDGAGDRAVPARPAAGLRRQPYLDPWRARRAGLRHRQHRGRACAGQPDAVAAQAEDHAHHRGRHARAAGDGART